MWDLLVLASLKRFSSVGALLLRLVVGTFLLWSVRGWLESETHLRGFAAYLGHYRFPLPYLMARLSAYAQAFIAVGFISGLLTRWAGLLCAVNFGMLLAMIARFAGIHSAFPSACLAAIGVFFAFYGSGQYGLDAFIEERARPRFDVHY